MVSNDVPSPDSEEPVPEPARETSARESSRGADTKPTAEIISNLKELADLRDREVITDQGLTQLKTRLLGELQ